MPERSWLEKESQTSIDRLIPRLERYVAPRDEHGAWNGYLLRLRKHFPRLFEQLNELYGNRYDFFYHLENIVTSATQMWLARSQELKALDAAREADPLWFQSHNMVGAMCYINLFDTDISGLREKIPYLKQLGISYLHLMPLFSSPTGENDGGYAISSYREVDAALGTMEDLKELATELRHNGISLVLDFVLNHTSDEHEWAKKALLGNADCQNYYRMFPDRKLPNTYEMHLPEVFPDEHPGAFTYRNRIRKWVWTTFHNYQWDLNYENPEVFNRMLEEMLFLANIGAEVIRFDALAFTWKRLGTNCQNLPQAHTLIQAFNTVARIVAPAVVFKSEAIVHPDEVNKYISKNECQLSYNPGLMALLWNALATREVSLLRHAMQKRFSIPTECAWVNYIRSHDDIGWTFSDEDASEINISSSDHRRFLAQFYTGRFPGSFACGLPFQENSKTGDCRISGTTASLVGLEKAIKEEDQNEIDLAIKRILLLHGVILTIGGIPLFYLGDELGTLNEYSYSKDPEKDGDTRWVHRPKFDWEQAELRTDANDIPGRIFQGLLRLIQIRQRALAFSRTDTNIVDIGNDHVFAYFRQHEGQAVLALANFTEQEQVIAGNQLRRQGLRKTSADIISGRTIIASQQLVLEPYQLMILVAMN